MSDLFSPTTKQVNPNTPQATAVQGSLGDLIMTMAQGGAAPGVLGQQNPLAQQVGQAFGGMVGINPYGSQPSQGGMTSFGDAGTAGGGAGPLQQQGTGPGPLGNPEVDILNQLRGPLMDMINQGSQGIGGFEQSQKLVGAAQPIFEQNLQGALGQLSNAAPGRFSTAFAGQGGGLAQRALQDFNLFQQQATQQGLGLDLQARGLSQQGVLGAGNLLGSLSAQAGQNPFARLLGAGQFGLQQQAAAQNPVLQLLLGGQQMFRPAPLDTAVGQSPVSQIAGLGAAAAAAFGGGG
jgi:hypothetical protein